MNRMLAVAALAALATTPALEALQAQPAPERPRVEKKEVKAEGVSVHYPALPWGPQTMATMETQLVRGKLFQTLEGCLFLL